MAILAKVIFNIPYNDVNAIDNDILKSLCSNLYEVAFYQQKVTSADQNLIIVQNKQKKQLETERPSSTYAANEIIKIAQSLMMPVENEFQSDEGRLLKLKMYINKKIGQLTDDRLKIKSNASAITQLITIAKKESKFLGAYAMKILASALLKQASNQVYINPKAALPLAWVACVVTEQCPEFYYVLFNALFESCIYTVPRYVNKTDTENIEQYKLRLGYKLIEGKLESDEFFFERSCGTVAFMASLYCIKESDIGSKNVFKVEDAWRWLASICNLPPRLITPALLTSFVEIAGNTMWDSYGQDFIKIIEYIEQIFCKMFSRHSQSYTARLKIVLEKYSKKEIK